MNGKYNSKIYYVIMAILLICPLVVSAEESPNDRNGVCVQMPDSNTFGYYLITDAGSSVKDFLGAITTDDINGTEQYPKLCYCSKSNGSCIDENGNCKAEYKFNASHQGKKCKITSSTADGYSFATCPISQKDVRAVNEIIDTYSVEYSTSRGMYEIKFDSKGYEDKIKIRFANSEYVNGKELFPKYVNGEISVKSESYSLKNPIYLSGGTQFYLVFYLDDASDPCDDTILGTFQGSTPTTIRNPMYNSQTCIDFQNKYGTEGINGIYRNMVSECDKEWITIEEAKTISATINQKINAVNELISAQNTDTQVSSSNNFTCQFELDSLVKNNVSNNFSTKTSILNVAGAGTYWTAQCTESISIEYDDPKVAKAGMGFPYTATVKISRTCKPIKIKEPESLPNCTYGVECYGPDHNGDAAAGPNEDFDECIHICDGGMYTQQCINSCYSEVYENASYSSTNYIKSDISFLTATNKNYQIRRLANESESAGGLPRTGVSISNNHDSSCYIEDFWAERGEYWRRRCVIHGIDFAFEDSCNNNTTCYGVYTNYPCAQSGGGSDGYEAKVKASIAEYNLVQAAIRKFDTDSKQEKYEILIEEEYNKQSDGSYQKITTIFDNQNSNYAIYKEDTTSDAKRSDLSTTKVTSNLGGLSEETKKQIEVDTSNITIERTIKVGIGDSYVSKITGDVVYNDNSNGSTLENNLNYKSGNKKYFTRLDTRVVNNYNYWPYYDRTNTNSSTDQYTKNIHVRFYNLGTWSQWGTEGNGINVDCFYGTTSGPICMDECCEPPCPTPTPTPPTPTPTPTSSPTPTSTYSPGLRYIFRPINLTDMFPNRDARFNWTGTITNSGESTLAALTKDKSGYDYAVDPEKLIEDIQSKGSSIYTDSSEVDYEFTLTKENIRNIRQYNKNVRDYNGDGEKNYLDYNMSCYTNAKNQEVCTSRFLDNVNGNSGTEQSGDFITYDTNGKGMTERKAIAGCNNAKSNDCASTSR